MGQILSELVETLSATWRLPPLAAVSISITASFLGRKKERRLSLVENRRLKKGIKISLPAAVFFFTATAGRLK